MAGVRYSARAYTSSTSVSLSLTFVDSVSGVSQVRYSNDGVWDTESWEAPSATKSWSLPSGDGTKTVYYQIKDNAGSTATFSSSIFLDMTLPVANAGQAQYVMVGTSVAFNGGGSIDNTGIASYLWDFGDGGTGTDVAPTHTYSSVGNYTVTLMVKDLAGNSAASSATVAIGVVIPEFPSVAAMAVLFAIVSAFSLILRRKQKLRNDVKT